VFVITCGHEEISDSTSLQMNPSTISDEEVFQQNLQRLLNASRTFNRSNFYTLYQDNQDLLFPDSIFDPWTEKLLITLYASLDLAGLFSNLLMITSLLISPTLIKDPCFFRFFLLMISNLMMCFFCLPFTLFFLIKRYWTLGKVACQFIPFLQSVAVIINTLTTAMISVDRLLLVTGSTPHRHRSSAGQTTSCFIWKPLLLETFIIWGIAIFASIPIPWFQEFVNVSIGPTVIIMKCVELWPSGHLKGYYLIVNMMIQFLIPAGILITTYFRITRHLTNTTAGRRAGNNVTNSSAIRRSRGMRYFSFLRTRFPVSVFVSRSGSLDHRVDSMTRSQHIRDKRVSRLLFWIVVCYTVTWGPWNLYNILLNYYSYTEIEAKSTHLTLALLYVLSMVNVPVNALLYGWNNPGIRRHAIRVLKSLKDMGHLLMPAAASSSADLQQPV
jgi:hypothetical protein